MFSKNGLKQIDTTLLIILFSLSIYANDSVKLELHRPANNAKLARNPWGFFEFWWKGPNKEGPYTIEVAKDPLLW